MRGFGPFCGVSEAVRTPIQAFERGSQGQNSRVEPSIHPGGEWCTCKRL
jgi:hypothetical protein